MFQRLFSMALLGLVLVLAGCSTHTRITTEADSYERAQTFLDNGRHSRAIDQLEAMENRFPFGAYAAQVQMDLIYAHYESNQYDRALRRANRFIRLQPAHPDVDYVYYMRGLISFGMAESRAGLLGTRNPVDRDISGYDDTFNQLQAFLDRFPDSEYTDNAIGLMQVSRSRLAEHSLNIAIYYYQTDRFESSLNRINKLLSEFPGEPLQDDTLALKVRVHQAMGNESEAEDTLALLRSEFPESDTLTNDQLTADFQFSRPWYFWATLGLVG